MWVTALIASLNALMLLISLVILIQKARSANSFNIRRIGWRIYVLIFMTLLLALVGLLACLGVITVSIVAYLIFTLVPCWILIRRLY